MLRLPCGKRDAADGATDNDVVSIHNGRFLTAKNAGRALLKAQDGAGKE